MNRLSLERNQLKDNLENEISERRKIENELNETKSLLNKTRKSALKSKTDLEVQISSLQDRIMSSEAEIRASEMLAQTGRRKLREELKNVKEEYETFKINMNQASKEAAQLAAKQAAKNAKDGEDKLEKTYKELEALTNDYDALQTNHQVITRQWGSDKEALRQLKEEHERVKISHSNKIIKYDELSSDHDALREKQEKTIDALTKASGELLNCRKQIDDQASEILQLREFVDEVGKNNNNSSIELQEYKDAFDQATTLAADKSMKVSTLEREITKLKKDHSEEISGHSILVTELTKRLAAQEDSCMALVECNSELSRELLLVQETLNLYMSKYDGQQRDQKEENNVDNSKTNGENVERENAAHKNGNEDGVKNGINEEENVVNGVNATVVEDGNKDGDQNGQKAMSMNELSTAMSSRKVLSTDDNVFDVVTNELDAIEKTTLQSSRRTAWHVMASYRSALRSIFNKYCTNSVFTSSQVGPGRSNSIESKLQSAAESAVGSSFAASSRSRKRRSLVMVMGNQEFQKFARDYKIAGGVVPHVNLHSLFERHCHYQGSHGGSLHSSPVPGRDGGGVIFFSEFQAALLELAEDTYEDVSMEKDVHSSTYCLGKLLLHIDSQLVGDQLSCGNQFKGLAKLIKFHKSKRKPRNDVNTKTETQAGGNRGDTFNERGRYISSSRNNDYNNDRRNQSQNSHYYDRRTATLRHGYNTPISTLSNQYQVNQQQSQQQEQRQQQKYRGSNRLSMTAPREQSTRNNGLLSGSIGGFATDYKSSDYYKPKKSTSEFRSISSSIGPSSTNLSKLPPSTPQGKRDGKAMYRMLSTLFGHYGRKHRDGNLTMKTFLRMAKASNIITNKNESTSMSSSSLFDGKKEGGGDSMITIKRLKSIIERVQTQYGYGNDSLKFSMSCAVLLRISRCQYLYRPEFLGSKDHTDILDATAFGALCLEKLAPLYKHLMAQLGGGGDRETKHITVPGSRYLLQQSKIACQSNLAIYLEEESDFLKSNFGEQLLSSMKKSGTKDIQVGEREGRKNSNSRSTKKSKQNKSGDDHQSWEDVVRQLRNANDIADGLLLVGTPSGKGSSNMIASLRSFEEEELQATRDVAVKLEAENQELKRRLNE